MQGQAYSPADDGFVFSPKTFVKFQSREEHLEQAVIAERVNFDLKKFKAAVANSRFHSQSS
jgi:hypothetical protein